MFRIKVSIIWLVFSVSMIISCAPPPQPTLNNEDMKLVDSLMQERREDMVKSLDSLCEVRYPSYVKHYSDSIKQIRLAEIEAMIYQNKVQ